MCKIFLQVNKALGIWAGVAVQLLSVATSDEPTTRRADGTRTWMSRFWSRFRPWPQNPGRPAHERPGTCSQPRPEEVPHGRRPWPTCQRGDFPNRHGRGPGPLNGRCGAQSRSQRWMNDDNAQTHCITSRQTPACYDVIANKSLFTSPRKIKTFQDFPSHRILWHMHGALNIDKNKN